MKCLISCYSTTGNTRLVADRIAEALSKAGVDTVVKNPVKQPLDDVSDYDIVGFGTPTMAFKPSLGFFEVMGQVPTQKKPVPAFVFCTSGGEPVNTLRTMASLLMQKSFVVIDGLEINAETNFPVARQFGGKALGLAGKPDDRAAA